MKNDQKRGEVSLYFAFIDLYALVLFPSFPIIILSLCSSCISDDKTLLAKSRAHWGELVSLSIVRDSGSGSKFLFKSARKQWW
jgi:hypothetical protein